MKYQVLFCLENNKKVFKSAAVVIGILRVRFCNKVMNPKDVDDMTKKKCRPLSDCS